jgi:hypothetical protein
VLALKVEKKNYLKRTMTEFENKNIIRLDFVQKLAHYFIKLTLHFKKIHNL